MYRTLIVVDTTNVSREEVSKLSEGLEEDCWNWFKAEQRDGGEIVKVVAVRDEDDVEEVEG